MSEFTARTPRVLHRAAFLELLERTVITPEGEEVVRVTVRHPGAVVVVPMDGDGQIVMVRQYRVAAERELLELPAGKREPGEAPEVTALRELREEVGLEAGALEPLVEFFNSPGFCEEYTHVYLASQLEERPRPADARAEERHLTVERWPLEAALDLVASGEIVDAKTIIGIALTHLQGRGGYRRRGRT